MWRHSGRMDDAPDAPRRRSSALRALEALGLLGLAGVAAATAMWLAESLHWTGALLGAVRPYVGVAALGVVAVLVLARRRWAGAAAGGLAVWNLAPVLVLYLPGPAQPEDVRAELTFVTANLREGTTDFGTLFEWLEHEKPDVVAFQEVQVHLHLALAASTLDYPHRFFWPEVPDPTAPREMGLALLSRVPFERIELVWGKWYGKPVIEAELVTLGRRVTVLCAHTTRPGRTESNAARDGMLRGIAERVKGVERVVLLGDLNVTGSQPIFDELLERANLLDSRRGFGWQPTWRSTVVVSGLPLDLDHVLVSPSMHVVDRRVGPDFGSDHLPVLAKLRF